MSKLNKTQIAEIMDNLTLGCDPEVFLSKGGELVSAVGLVQGTKENPFPVKNGAVQLDGMAAEFNIDPAKNKTQWERNIMSVMKQLRKMVGNEYKLEPIPVAEFGEAVIKAQPASAQELGCEPDFNAYTGKANTPPNADAPFRTGAGHIHIGWTSDMDVNDPRHLVDCRNIAMALDIGLALPSLMFDTGSKRRELYGELGCFRPKPYGMEYRVLSNAWLRNAKLRAWVFNQTRQVFENYLRQGKQGVDAYWFSKDSIKRMMEEGILKNTFKNYFTASTGFTLPPC